MHGFDSLMRKKGDIEKCCFNHRIVVCLLSLHSSHQLISGRGFEETGQRKDDGHDGEDEGGDKGQIHHEGKEQPSEGSQASRGQNRLHLGTKQQRFLGGKETERRADSRTRNSNGGYQGGSWCVGLNWYMMGELGWGAASWVLLS